MQKEKKTNEEKEGQNFRWPAISWIYGTFYLIGREHKTNLGHFNGILSRSTSMIFYFELFHKFFKSVRNHRGRGKEKKAVTFCNFSHYWTIWKSSLKRDTAAFLHLSSSTIWYGPPIQRWWTKLYHWKYWNCDNFIISYFWVGRHDVMWQTPVKCSG